MNLITKGWYITALMVLFLLFAIEKPEHNTQLKPKQIAIMKLAPTTRKTIGRSDTITYWSIGAFGKSFPINAYHINRNQRHIYILTM
jgi:hypothetical protein